MITPEQFKSADELYTMYVSRDYVFAIITFTGDNALMLPLHEAVQLIELLTDAEPVKPRNYLAPSTHFSLPTMRILTAYERRCLWLANHMNCTVNDIEEHCKYDPGLDIMRQHALSFAAPDVTEPDVDNVLDQDLRG